MRIMAWTTRIITGLTAGAALSLIHTPLTGVVYGCLALVFFSSGLWVAARLEESPRHARPSRTRW